MHAEIPSQSEKSISRRSVMRFGLGAVAFASVFGLAACGRSGPAYRTKTPGDATVVTMHIKLKFSPANITVQVGDTVEWRNRSLFTHTVTADKSLAKNPEHVVLPVGAEPFDSGDIPPGEVFRHTFTVSGEYAYFCIPHERHNMLGRVTVNPAA